jgi:hypothetical protein
MASKKSTSKRQSAGKPEQLQLDDFILYLDENLDNCQPILEALHNIKSSIIVTETISHAAHRTRYGFNSWQSDHGWF